MQYLLDVLNSLQSIDAYEIKKSKQNHLKDQEKYIDLISAEEKKIDKLILELKEFDLNDSSEVVCAYVTFRSMEGG